MTILTGNLYIDASAIAIALLAVLITFMKWSFTFWERKGVYAPTPTIPFGNANNLVMQKECIGVEFKNVYQEIRNNGKKYGGYYFFTKPIFIPADLDLVKLIMTKDFVHFTNHVNHIDEVSEPLTGHLFSLKGSKWKNLRTKLTPTFTSGKMKMMFHTLVDCSDGLVEVVGKSAEAHDPIDIKDVVARFTTDIIGSCAFGIECNSLKDPNAEFREYGRKVFHASVRDSISRLMTFTVPELLKYIKLRTFRKDVSDFFMKAVKDTVSYRELHNIKRKDFMHLLIQLKNNVKIKDNDVGDLQNGTESNGTTDKSESKPLTIEELAAQAFVFFVAGYETSSTTSTFCLYELVTHIEMQDKLREEVNTVLEKHGGKLTYDAVMDMTYMDKCINETLRKYPPVPVHTRECTETYKVPNSEVVLQKGSFVFIPVMGIQYDPEIYPDPDKFDPERFSEENKAIRHSAAWTPFGDGPRTCIGLRFGVMQTKVALAVLLKNYKFTLNSKTATPLVMDPGMIILTAESGIWLNAEKI